MQTAVNILLIVAGLFLIGNAAISFVASAWARRFADNWFLAPLANRWGVGRVRVFLIVNGVLTGMLGIVAVSVGVYVVVT